MDVSKLCRGAEMENEYDRVASARSRRENLVCSILFPIGTIFIWWGTFFLSHPKIPDLALWLFLFGSAAGPFFTIVSWVSYAKNFNGKQQQEFIWTFLVGLVVVPAGIILLAIPIYFLLGWFIPMPFWASIIMSLLVLNLFR